MDRAGIEVQMKECKGISFVLSFYKMTKAFEKALDKAQERIWEGSQNAYDFIFHPCVQF